MDKIKDPFLTEFLEDPLFHDAKFAESLILITLLCGSRIIYAKYFIAVLKVLFKNEKIFRRYYELGMSCLANETLFYDLLHNSNPYKSDPCQTILNKCSAEDFVETEAILIDAIISQVDVKLCEFLISNPPNLSCIADLEDSDSIFVQKVKKKIGGFGENASVLRGWALNLKSKTPLYQINQGKTLNKVIEFLTKLLGLAGEMRDQALKNKLEADLQFTLRIILNLVFNVDSAQAARMLHHTVLSPIVKKSSSWVSNFISLAIFDLLNTIKNCFKDYPAEIIENSSRLALYFTYIERVGGTISSLLIYYLSFYESSQLEAGPAERERIKADARILLVNLFQSEGFGVIINAIQKTKNLFVRVQSFLVILIHIYIFKNWTFGNQNLEFLKKKGIQPEIPEKGSKREEIVQRTAETVENLIRDAEKNPEYVNILRGLLNRDKSPQSNEVSEVIRALTRFETRHQILKLNLDSCHRPGEMRLFVRKDRVLSDSFDIIRNMPGEKLKISLQVNFIQDNNPIPGKFNEWMEILFQQAVDEKYGLFTKLAIPNTYEINSESWVQDNHLNYFEFLGKMLAKALMEKFEMKVLFPVSFYKILFNRSLTLEDLIEVNPQLFDDLYVILKNPIADKEIYFVSNLNAPVGTKEVLLKPDGKDIRVTEDNKHEYVNLMLGYTLFGKIKDQMINLKKGFYTLVAEEFFLPFTACELEAVMCRIPFVDLDEFKPFIEYEGVERDSSYVQWLWEVIFQLDNADISNIFYAVLGTTKISVDTFQQAKMKVRVVKEESQLPSSDIGSRTLTLPLYQSKQELQEKLLLSMRFYEGFVVEPQKITVL